MMKRILTFAAAIAVGLALALPAAAADKKAEEKAETKTEKKAEKKAEKKTVAADAKKVKASGAFMARWKKIQKVTKKQAYETQQTRTVAGVRGAEAEDALLDQLYYKGGVRYPSRVDLKNAISQLQEAIAAEPEGEAVPEQKFFIAQCHQQLGELTEAKAAYGDLVKNHADTDWAKQAAAELEKLEKTEE